MRPWALLLLTSALLSSVSAWAQGPKEDGPSEIDKDAARTSLEQGDERMAAKDYKAALEAYQRADEIMGVPTTAIEVGRAALALGRLVIAEDAFRRAADFPKKDREPAPFTKAREEALAALEKLSPRIPTVTLEIGGVTGDVDIEVTLDEETIDAWGRPLRLDPGGHDVRASAVGYKPAETHMVLSEGDNKTVSLVLEPIATTTPLPDTVEESSPWWTVAIISLPIGGASLIAGAVTGGLSLSDASAVKDQCDGNRCPPEAQDKLDSSQTLAHVSTATLALGGVATALGVAAVAIAVTTDGEDAGEGEASVMVSPTGLALRVTF